MMRYAVMLSLMLIGIGGCRPVSAPDSSPVPVPVAAASAAAGFDCAPQAVVAGSCQVSDDIYVGWRIYHSSCNHCHGQDAGGSSFAPELVELLSSMDKPRFLEVTGEGYQGELGVMPGFADNPNINGKLEQLFAFLRARAQGLPRGRPGRPAPP